MVKEIGSEDEFREILKNNEVVIVDWSASWCGPCKKIAPEYEKLSNEFKSISFFKIDCDNEEFSGLMTDFKIKSIPTFQIWKNKKLLSSFSGADLKPIVDYINKMN